MSNKPRIILGVGASIAAYKTCDLIRKLRADSFEVVAVPTVNSLNFITKSTLEALTANPVYDSVFGHNLQNDHVNLGKNADLLVIAPATADLISKLAQGRADDLLTATVLMSDCPKIIVPAMHSEMWLNPITRANVAKLKQYGFIVLPVGVGKLTSGDSGLGRMMEPVEIADLIKLIFTNPELLQVDLSGKKVLITAGGLREKIDPVRFIGNRSSGKQGFALAKVASLVGAKVKVIATKGTEIPDLAGVEISVVEDFADLRKTLKTAVANCDYLFMAAAVSDFRLKKISETKIKKDKEAELRLDLVENPDLLQEITGMKLAGEISDDTVIIGFAAETGDSKASVLEYAKAKLKKKQVDFLVLNPVFAGNAFESDNNSGYIFGKNAEIIELNKAPKIVVAAKIIENIVLN